MELRQLKYFLAIVDSGSLSKAAERLFIAQSALSQQIAHLEADLGTRLLHRSVNGVSLTDSGKIFYEHAQAIMRQTEDARSAVRQMSEHPVGTVVLGIPQSVSAALALPLLLAIRQELPQVTLQITEELTGHLTEQLRHGRINLAILFDDGQLKEFARKRIVEEKLYLIRAAAGDASRDTGRVTLAEALKTPLVLSSIQHGVRQRIERIATEQGLAVANLVAEINSINILKSAIMAGVGNTILPLSPFKPELEQGKLAADEISEPEISRTLTLCGSRNVPITRPVAAVSKLVVRVTRDLCAAGQWPGAQPIYHDNTHLVT